MPCLAVVRTSQGQGFCRFLPMMEVVKFIAVKFLQTLPICVLHSSFIQDWVSMPFHQFSGKTESPASRARKMKTTVLPTRLRILREKPRSVTGQFPVRGESQDGSVA